ncbi:hypothetical protein LXL04_023335 [Taraxacum kok-saghyz]
MDVVEEMVVLDGDTIVGKRRSQLEIASRFQEIRLDLTEHSLRLPFVTPVKISLQKSNYFL